MGLFGKLFGSSGDGHDYSDNITCPNCGVTCYWHEDDDYAYWACPNCGHHVEGGEVDFDNDSNTIQPVIDWNCDNCGASLNIQSGFDPYQDHWTCTECGYENDTSESNIIR